MSLRFMLGRSGTGKTKRILDEITDKLMENPAGHPIIYLVPDQMTFQSEYKLITTPGLNGMIRAQVYSFSRLAWRVLQETGGMTRTHLNSVGITMLIQKILEDKKDELKIFQRSSDKQGFIGHVEEILTEFKRYCISPGKLKEYNGIEQPGNGAVTDKLHDLQLIYETFENELLGKYIDSEDYFTLLAEKIDHSSYLRNAEIYMDGFYSLTPQELLVLDGLMKVCPNITVSLTMDKPAGHPEESHLFRQTENTYHTLYSMALKNHISVDEQILDQPNRFRDPSLRHLEAAFSMRPLVPYTDSAKITICQAVSRRAEVEGTARKIAELAREKNYRWRDIAILVRNSASYQDIIQTIFKDYEIPIFIDAKRSMLNHPVIELIRSVLEVLATNWRYEPVFRAIKTELFFPVENNPETMRRKADILENYVLSRGIKGGKWTGKERWSYRKIRGLDFHERGQTDEEKQTEALLNELKDLVAGPIMKLFRRLKRAVDGRDYCEAIYLFLEELRIPEKLEKLKLGAEEDGDLAEAREHEQAWNAIIELLDQFVEMLGDDRITLKKFITILDAGMENMKFSLVPPAIDQVLVTNVDLSRLSDIKAAFAIGLNEGVLPAKIIEEGVFSDNDREKLLSDGIEIAPNTKVRLLDEEFTAYKLFTTPSERLYLSYPLADEEGKSLIPSSYIKRVKELFPEAPETYWVNDPSEALPEDQLGFAVNYDTALSYLASQLQLKKRNYPIHPMWWDVYNAYLERPDLKRDVSLVLSSLFYKNKTKKLSSDTSKMLYGDTIQASVSRMEMFNSCPFSHFAAHGLKLEERKIFRLDAPDIGEMFHAALKLIADHLQERNISWAALTKQECMELAAHAVESLAPKLQNQILLSSNRHHYIARKLQQVIGRASIVLSEHARASGFSPVGLELGFGKNGELPPLTFSLKNGTRMELAGRIDRVDKAEDQNGLYLRVLDYKSSSRELNLSEVYYGLALQMLTYLDIIVTHSKSLVGKEAMPAGVLYFHVHNPVVKSSGMLSKEQIEEEIFKSFKMKGLLLGERGVLELMDSSLENGSSHIIQAGFKKDGNLNSSSKVASSQEFSNLNKYVRNVYQQAGDEIVSGNVEIAPYKLKEQIPCTFCSYKSVCQFDASLEDNEYRVLTPKKEDEILSLIKGGNA
ncbi:ATP-dependent helicase/nuclease subunit B [Peribacillus deserti]|uniref:ATP-dependent helicase/deoxyribonuclease subunit B n=1 Tax=Peribacillus deserti TaxID=673318 RepID=A0ABS2QLF3_9BACI|nr:helicase-exonuclease AddAB subunit AddB [Peribacillus deserti]MBM7694008.1 ATP-dependent helicase/nuclease subunit B [Peribacillus deserti]